MIDICMRVHYCLRIPNVHSCSNLLYCTNIQLSVWCPFANFHYWCVLLINMKLIRKITDSELHVKFYATTIILPLSYRRIKSFYYLKGTLVRLMSDTHQLFSMRWFSILSDSIPRLLVWKFPPIIQFSPYSQCIKLCRLHGSKCFLYLVRPFGTYLICSPRPIIDVHVLCDKTRMKAYEKQQL